MASALNNLATVYRAQRRYDEAHQLYERALGIVAAREGKNSPEYGRMLNNRAFLYGAQNRHREAEVLFREALEVFRRSPLATPPMIAAAEINLCGNLAEQSRPVDAEAVCRMALARWIEVAGEDSLQVANVRFQLAGLRVALGDDAGALALNRQVQATAERYVAEAPDFMVAALTQLAELERKAGRTAQAEAAEKRAAEIRAGQPR